MDFDEDDWLPLLNQLRSSLRKPKRIASFWETVQQSIFEKSESQIGIVNEEIKAKEQKNLIPKQRSLLHRRHFASRFPTSSLSLTVKQKSAVLTIVGWRENEHREITIRRSMITLALNDLTRRQKNVSETADYKEEKRTTTTTQAWAKGHCFFIYLYIIIFLL